MKAKVVSLIIKTLALAFLINLLCVFFVNNEYIEKWILVFVNSVSIVLLLILNKMTTKKKTKFDKEIKNPQNIVEQFKDYLSKTDEEQIKKDWSESNDIANNAHIVDANVFDKANCIRGVCPENRRLYPKGHPLHHDILDCSWTDMIEQKELRVKARKEAEAKGETFLKHYSMGHMDLDN